MREEIFIQGIAKLQRAFRVKLHPETTAIYRDRLLMFSDTDWSEAIDHLIDEAEGFPRVAAFKKLLMRTAVNRREGDQKCREEAAAKRKPSSGSVGDVLKSLPFPKELKQALRDKIDGKIDQAQLEGICKKYSAENRDPKQCGCEDGLVFYSDALGYSYVGRCAKCGVDGPKGYPMVDPVTLQVAEARA